MNRSRRIAGTATAATAVLLGAAGTIAFGPLAPTSAATSAATSTTTTQPITSTELDTTGLDAGIDQLSTEVSTLRADLEATRARAVAGNVPLPAPSTARRPTPTHDASHGAPATHAVTGASSATQHDDSDHGEERSDHGEERSDHGEERGHGSDD